MIGVREQEALLLNLASKLPVRMTVFAVGGTAMMFHGFKDVTKDIDLVFTSPSDREAFRRAALAAGYTPFMAVQVYGVKENQPLMLARGDAERFDLFLNEVIDFTFSEAMQRRASATHEFAGQLVLKIADPHDIILMKCATDRIKDKDDAREIISHSRLDWNIIIDEAVLQVRLGRGRAVWDLAGFVDDLNKIGAKIPAEVLPRLLRTLEGQSQQKRLDNF